LQKQSVIKDVYQEYSTALLHETASMERDQQGQELAFNVNAIDVCWGSHRWRPFPFL